MVLFVCLHGSAKSLIAATHFNRLAETRGLSIRASSAGVEPDALVPDNVISGLAHDGIDVREYKPMLVTAELLGAASRIVSFGCDIQSVATVDAPIDYWNDLPMVSDGFANARDAILARVTQLLNATHPPTA